MKRLKAMLATLRWEQDKTSPVWVCWIPKLRLQQVYFRTKREALKKAAEWLKLLAKEYGRPFRLNVYRKPKRGNPPGIEREYFYPRRLDPKRSKG